MADKLNEIYRNVTQLIFGLAIGFGIAFEEFQLSGLFAIAYSVMFVAVEIRELRKEVDESL